MAADPAILAAKEVTALYLVANTPTYLYRHLRANPSVKALADASSIDELAALVAKIDRKRKRTPQDLAVGYSAVVAATFHADARAVRAAFDGLRLRRLEWARSILDFWYETQRTTVVRTIVLEPRLAEPVSPSAGATSTSLITLPGAHQ